MIVFDRNDKINFVDENNVVVGFDNVKKCCETFDYYITPLLTFNKQIKTSNPNLTNYRFDPTFFKEKSIENDENNTPNEKQRRRQTQTTYTVFRLYSIDKQPDLYLILYNSQNKRYYSHGFECKVNGKVIHSGSL